MMMMFAPCLLQISGIGSVGDDAGVRVNSVSSQFASLDSVGTLLLWMTSENRSDGEDFGMSPWSKVSLLVTRVLRLEEAVSAADKFLNSAGKAVVPTMAALRMWDPTHAPLAHDPVFIGVPNDASSFLVSAPMGRVRKLSRFGGKAPVPSWLVKPSSQRWTITSSRQSASSDVGPSAIEYDSPVTAMAAAWSSASSSAVLVGRGDGTVDLFDPQVAVALFSWRPLLYRSADRGDDRSLLNEGAGRAIVSLKWMSVATEVAERFLAVDAAGFAYYYDLTRNPHAPIEVGEVSLRCTNQTKQSGSSASALLSAISLGGLPGMESSLVACARGSAIAMGAVTEEIARKRSPVAVGDAASSFKQSLEAWIAEPVVPKTITDFVEAKGSTTGDSVRSHK